MRRCDTIRGREVEDRKKDEEMTAPITLPGKKSGEQWSRQLFPEPNRGGSLRNHHRVPNRGGDGFSIFHL
jgi:hypothetical protein